MKHVDLERPVLNIITTEGTKYTGLYRIAFQKQVLVYISSSSTVPSALVSLCSSIQLVVGASEIVFYFITLQEL